MEGILLSTENQFGTTCYISDALAGIEVSALLAHKVANADQLSEESIESTIHVLAGEDARAVNTLAELAMATDMLMEDEEKSLEESMRVIDDSLHTLKYRRENF